MKALRLLPLLLFVLPAARASDCCEAPAPAPVAEAAPASHPVRGVVMGLLPDKTALLVKHEAVPGVMRAMTMLFKVEPDVLTRVKEGDAIEARMSRREDGWWLTEIKILPPTK